MNKAQGFFGAELEILIYMQDQHLSATSNVNLSTTESHNIKHSHTNVIYELRQELGLLQWGNEASLIRYRINKSSKPL